MDDEHTEKPQSKINNTTFGLLLVVFGLVDLAQFLIGFLDVIFIGTPINWCIDIFAGLGFYIWLKPKGVNFGSPKNLTNLLGALFFKAVPILEMLPAWTFLVVRTTINTRAEEKLAAVAPVVARVASRGTPRRS